MGVSSYFSRHGSSNNEMNEGYCMKLIVDLPATVRTGEFVILAGAQLRSVADNNALIKVWEEVATCFGYPKPDGWRMQIHKMGDDVFLFSRSGKNWTTEFPAIVRSHS